MKYFFFNYNTNQLEDMGEHESWKAAYDTVENVYIGIVYSEESLRKMANDSRFPKTGVMIQNAKTRQPYRIVENEDGTLSMEGPQPSPPPDPPRRWRGD